jgi:hypothetical protein
MNTNTAINYGTNVMSDTSTELREGQEIIFKDNLPNDYQTAILPHLLMKRVFPFVLNSLPILPTVSLTWKQTPLTCAYFVCFNGNQMDLKI